MVHARARVMSVSAMLVMVAAAVAWSLVHPVASPAADVDALLPSQTMFLTERFTQTGPQGGVAGGTNRELVTLRGEREGFQLAVQNTSGRDLQLAARVVADNALGSAQGSGTIGFELLRVGFVSVPQASTGLGTSAGSYADPLPPLRTDSGAAGMLSVPNGQWGGFAVIAKVRTDAPSGLFSGNVELYSGETVFARQPFSLDVRNATLLQSGENGSFTTVLNVEGEAYWLQHTDMRDRPRGTDLWANRMAQLAGLVNFLDARGVTPAELPFGNPSKTGVYNCSFAAKNIPTQSFLDQTKNRYFAGSRDIDPTRTKFPVRFVPTKTVGCDPDKLTAKFEATVDPLHTPSIKQDDAFNPAAPSFFGKVRATWDANGLWGTRTYLKHPFDEPSTSKPSYKRTMDVEVPKTTIALRKAFGSKAKVMIADWPRDSSSRRVCVPFKTGTSSGKSCTTVSGDEHSNKKTWDGKGADDPDVWMAPFSRLFGRTTPPKLVTKYKVNRDREYADRLAKIKKLRGGREVWAYNFYTADKRVPQLSIDSPGTDARLQYWMLAREGHTGVYVSNLMMGWGQDVKNHPGSSLRRKGNPYDEALYFKHAVYGVAAGWGTFIYPGYRPELGLVGEEARNSEQAMPVTSLRLEGMRDGGEDANLHRMYRAAKGEAAYQALIKSVFPGKYIPLTGSPLGNVVMLKYDNGSNLAQRMETVRRQMMTELTS